MPVSILQQIDEEVEGLAHRLRDARARDQLPVGGSELPPRPGLYGVSPCAVRGHVFDLPRL